MGLLDNLRDRLTGGFDGDYEDDYYDDYDDDEGYDDEPTGSGILGNTSRPEAESVAVYTRSGRPVGTNAGAPTAGASARSTTGRSSTGRGSSSARPGSGSRSNGGYSSYRRNNDDYDDGMDDYAPSGAYSPSQGSLNTSGQLPPYVLRAEGYEDVQTVVRRVRTNQPVLLVLTETPADAAQRILDFSYGLSFGIGGEVQAIDSKAFLVLPAGIQLSPSEIDRLASQAR
ncbi:MAG: cell division protein SepF [Atopobiaceae bacterium]|nr:cell division protein SepF [Atopobiaceae bacterium]